jgi:nitrilase
VRISTATKLQSRRAKRNLTERVEFFCDSVGIIGGPLTVGEGDVIADLDFAEIDKHKRLMDAQGHYSRPELFSLLIDWRPASPVHEHVARPTTAHAASISDEATTVDVL